MAKVIVEGNTVWVVPDDDIASDAKKMSVIRTRQWHRDKKAWKVDISELESLKFIFGENNVVTKSILNDEVSIYQDLTGFDGLNCTLYPFQVIGANFAYLNRKVLIADVMGLGKTMQALAAFIKLKNNMKALKCLVVCPASLKYQWFSEIENKTNLTGIVIKSPSKFSNKKKEDKERLALSQFDNRTANIFIINYEQLLNDLIFEKVKEIGFDTIIFDEAHYIKNRTAKRSKKAYEIAKMASNVICLSGTPLENRPEELYGVFQAIDPKLFGSFSSFAKRYIKFIKYGIIVGYRNLGELRAKIQPYIIRRTLDDVALQLPEKIIKMQELEMTDEQKRLHDEILQSISEDFERLEEVSSKYKIKSDIDFDSIDIPEPIKNIRASILGKYTFLLEICNSPELLLMSDSKLAGKLGIKDTTSPKLDAVEEIVDTILDQGSKVVIFTQFERMLRLISQRLKSKSDIAYIYGGLDPKTRQLMVEKFVKDTKCNILLATDAGNTGLNLQAANYMIMVDPPLKPSVYEQRCGRIVRIGSKYSTAIITNLVMMDGWDKQIFRILDKKSQYVKDLIDKRPDEIASIKKAADNITNDLNTLARKLIKQIGK